jgi:preprotein translocase subunit SecE
MRNGEGSRQRQRTQQGAQTGQDRKARPCSEARCTELFGRVVQYLRDVRSEMKRVVWPERPEVINSSIVVIVTLLFFAAFTFVVDAIVVQLLQLFARLG